MERKFFATLLITISFVLCLGLLPVHGEEDIYDSVVRLHVLANSDSEEDQELKLKVRDKVIELTETLLEGKQNRSEAMETLSAHLDDFEKTALSVIEENGYSYTVSARLGEEEYPTRKYDSICFPCGTYVSLQIKIGEAEGKNWWCVLFPPLCLSAASSKDKEKLEQSFIAVGLTPEQYRIITESENSNSRYKIRFKILELIRQIFD